MQKTIGDIDVAYTAQGQGPAVVMVHGLAECRESFAATQAALSDYHTHAYDLRGHGETSLGEPRGSLEQLRDDLIGFLEAVTGPAQCVGYSLGGTVVLAAAVARPDLVTQAVVVGTSTVVGTAAANFFGERIAMLEADRAAFDQGLLDDTRGQILNPEVDVAEVAQRRIAAVGDGGGYINAATAMMRVHAQPLNPELAAIQSTVQVIGADGDVFCPRKAADIMMSVLPHARYREIQHAGHLMSVDQPQAYAQVLREALEDIEP